jgi:hypothetical protein
VLDIQVKQANGSAPRGVRPADERIGLVDLLDEQGPITAALFAISSRLPGPVQREAGLRNPPDASYALEPAGCWFESSLRSQFFQALTDG